ncbi:unnamed protein product [Acanthoscelides obtectus]|uniref:Uncharacterized protein n=1 Tax=Acanthoscelides obtectus TaxID=200917 RepID=A0A9P0LN09_ACAOB|nr:unnamed protein product [Acanthoscelides obtectus]CAK1637630.1 hypothetical protein AOBTE_LOCUS10099 [Acanthoscelides obtectus]
MVATCLSSIPLRTRRSPLGYCLSIWKSISISARPRSWTPTPPTVFSPALVDQQWDSDHVLHAIKQLQTLTPKLIVVALKELPKDEAQPKNSQGETLATITRSVPMLQWTRRDNEKFWYALRLELPAKRNTVNHQISSDKETRLTDSCKDTNVDDIV